MAVTADSVVVRLEADTDQYLRNIKQADTQFTAAIGHINSQAPRAAGAMNGLSGQVGNVAAQFQDIGVQLAGGQSPLLIALQQGTQLSAVMQQTANPVKALGAAFLSIVSPVSIATIATIALGGAAIQYLGTLLGDGRSATEVIKEQNDNIRLVAENWGAAVPALRAYVDELDRAADAENLSQAYDDIITGAFENLRAKIPEVRAELAAARIDIQAVGGEAQEIDALQATFDELARKVEDGTATSADLDAVLARLASTTGSATVPSLINLQGVLAGVANALAFAARAAADANAELAALNNRAAGRDLKERFAQQEFISEQERINSLTTEQLQLENEVARVQSQYKRDNDGAILSETQALAIAQGRLSAEERRSAIIKANQAGAKSGASAVSEAQRERDAVLDLISALQFEQSLVGLTSAEKAVQNALRRAGAAATDDERAAIEELITTTYAQQEAIAAATKVQQQFEQIAASSLNSFISDLRDGKSAAEALSNVFDNLANQLINIAVQGLVQQAFGGGGGFNPLGFLFGGARANGGPVSSSKAYLVGERGAELFRPSTAGNIVPNNALGGGSSEVTINVQSNEYFNATVQRISGPVAVRAATSAVSNYDTNLSSRMVEQDARSL